MDTVILKLHHNYHNHKTRNTLILAMVNLLLLVYFALFICVGPFDAWARTHEALWYEIYHAVNPFTTGAYIVGLAVLIQHVMYDGWVIKSLISLFYAAVICASWIATMGMTSPWEMWIYLPHLLVIILCVAVSYRKRKIREI